MAETNNSPPGEISSGSSDDAQADLVADESSLAWKIFNAFIDGSEMTATEEELLEYAVKELKVDLSDLPPLFLENYAQIMVVYMNIWTGWMYKKEYLDGKFKKQHYFNRFQKYLAHKIRGVGNTTLVSKVLKSLPSNASQKMYYHLKSPVKSNGQPQTSSAVIKKNPQFSQYAIAIQCPPHMLSTIVFSNIGDDVVLKQHLRSNWQDLSTAQLMNWPHVEVSFRSSDLCFVRRQATDYVRYLNFHPHECRNTNESIIESVESIGINAYGRAKSCYTYRFLEEYIKEYLLSLKTIKDITGLKLEEIQTILSQFLEDVKHINIKNSMVTNTVVLFTLSQVPFIRNKKLVKDTDIEGDDARVGYCEIITPKVELVMLYFKPQQNDTPYISFESTDKIKKTIQGDVSSVLPYIAYKCTFCRVEYNTGNTKAQMLDHLKKDHKMEQHVRCTVCKKEFDVLNLAACRWRHKCTQSTSSLVIL